MKQLHPFVSLTNFLDPKLTNDGKPYGPIRYKAIVQECYIIAKNANTSYTDLMNITPIEKQYLLEFIMQEFEANKKAQDEFKANIERQHGDY